MDEYHRQRALHPMRASWGLALELRAADTKAFLVVAFWRWL